MTRKQKAALKATRLAKQKLINKAAVRGVWENFGQKEIRALRDKYDYTELVYGNYEDRCIATEINNLEDWAMSYTV